MEGIELEKVIDASPTWIKKRFGETYPVKKSNVINIIRGIFESYVEVQDTAFAEVWNQIFINTSTGNNLTKHGNVSLFPLVVPRLGLSDDDYRNQLSMFKSVVAMGSTVQAVISFVESKGFTVYRVSYMYNTDFDCELGGNRDGETGRLLFSLSRERYRNYSYYIEIAEIGTPESELEKLEETMKYIRKVNHFVYVRNRGL